ncbi:MAG: hypothetical protein AOA65_1813 [Candidatus Bathyarchaeota archaeon BA1]|nr:MAG: hypothetical protein AOA65_1813 [Candidatus Bathyarchaeota archaeon BA1]
MSMNLGLATEEMATATKIYEKSQNKGIRTWLKL